MITKLGLTKEDWIYIRELLMLVEIRLSKEKELKEIGTKRTVKIINRITLIIENWDDTIVDIHDISDMD